MVDFRIWRRRAFGRALIEPHVIFRFGDGYLGEIRAGNVTSYTFDVRMADRKVTAERHIVDNLQKNLGFV